MHYSAMKYSNDYQIHYCIFIIYDKLPNTQYKLRNLQLPDDGQHVWQRHVGVVYNKYENIVQVFGGVICVYD